MSDYNGNYLMDLAKHQGVLDAIQEKVQSTIEKLYAEREKVLEKYVSTGGTSGTTLDDYMVVECMGGWGGITAWLRHSSDEWVLVTPLPALRGNAAALMRRAYR